MQKRILKIFSIATWDHYINQNVSLFWQTVQLVYTINSFFSPILNPTGLDCKLNFQLHFLTTSSLQRNIEILNLIK